MEEGVAGPEIETAKEFQFMVKTKGNTNPRKKTAKHTAGLTLQDWNEAGLTVGM